MPSPEGVESFLSRMNEAGMAALEGVVNSAGAKPADETAAPPQARDPDTGKFTGQTEEPKQDAESGTQEDPAATEDREVEVLGGRWKESEVARWRDVAEREKAGLSDFQQFQLKVRQEAEAVEAERARLTKLEFEAKRKEEEAESILALAMEDEEGFLRQAERLKAQGYRPDVKKQEPKAPVTAESIAAELAKLNAQSESERARAQAEANSNKTYVETLTNAIKEKAGGSQTKTRMLWAAVNTLERQKHLRPGMEPSFIQYAVESISAQLNKELDQEFGQKKPAAKAAGAPAAKPVPPSTGGGTPAPTPPKMDRKILAGDPGSYASALMEKYKTLGMLEPSN